MDSAQMMRSTPSVFDAALQDELFSRLQKLRTVSLENGRAADLGRFLDHEPVRARPIPWAGRLARWCRRKPALASALGLAGGLLALVAVGSPIALLRSPP